MPSRIRSGPTFRVSLLSITEINGHPAMIQAFLIATDRHAGPSHGGFSPEGIDPVQNHRRTLAVAGAIVGRPVHIADPAGDNSILGQPPATPL